MLADILEFIIDIMMDILGYRAKEGSGWNGLRTFAAAATLLLILVLLYLYIGYHALLLVPAALLVWLLVAFFKKFLL